MTDSLRQTMVDRVSSARGCVDWDRCNGRRPQGSCDECKRSAYETIEAMRVPSRQMLERCGAITGIDDEGRGISELDALGVWVSMIDAALQEGAAYKPAPTAPEYSEPSQSTRVSEFVPAPFLRLTEGEKVSAEGVVVKSDGRLPPLSPAAQATPLTDAWLSVLGSSGKNKIASREQWDGERGMVA